MTKEKLSTNIIYDRCRTKRKYHRKPLCSNKSRLCTYEVCRCYYFEELQQIAQGKRPKPVLATIDEIIGDKLMNI